VGGDSALLRSQLDEVLDIEAVGLQEADPRAVAEMEIHRLIFGPLEAMHAEVGPEELVARKDVLVGDAEHEEGPVDDEDELAARPKQPGSFGDPAVGVPGR